MIYLYMRAFHRHHDDDKININNSNEKTHLVIRHCFVDVMMMMVERSLVYETQKRGYQHVCLLALKP